jgi:hypothetical protein
MWELDMRIKAGSCSIFQQGWCFTNDQKGTVLLMIKRTHLKILLHYCRQAKGLLMGRCPTLLGVFPDLNPYQSPIIPHLGPGWGGGGGGGFTLTHALQSDNWFLKSESDPKLSDPNPILFEFVDRIRKNPKKTFNKLNFLIKRITVYQCQIFNF